MQKLDTSQYSGSNYRSGYQQTQYAYNTYHSYEYRLGKQFQDKLKLTTQEVSWLNKFRDPANVFLGIEGCCIETIKLYLAALKNLDKLLKRKESTLAKEVEFFQAAIMKLHQAKYHTTYWRGYDNSYLRERAESEFFCTIFKRAENTVREVFGHKLKISADFPYFNPALVQQFESRIGFPVNQIIHVLASSITPPDEKTEVELNAQNVSRWKLEFGRLKKSFSEVNKPEFINGIYALEKSNQKNPFIDNIFFEASRFIARFYKPEALRFYIYYLYYNLKSNRLNNKRLAKTIPGNLFKTNLQFLEFQEVVAGFVKDQDLKLALEETVKIYQTKRKQILLDVSAIKEVQQQEQDTVELLNRYLKDEFEDKNAIIEAGDKNQQEIIINISSSVNEEKKSPFVDGISLTENQAHVINLFVEKSFEIPANDINLYCKGRGVFRNQLIESINESCYDILDDLLIEEGVDNFTMNEGYYKKISRQ